MFGQHFRRVFKDVIEHFEWINIHNLAGGRHEREDFLDTLFLAETEQQIRHVLQDFSAALPLALIGQENHRMLSEELITEAVERVATQRFGAEFRLYRFGESLIGLCARVVFVRAEQWCLAELVRASWRSQWRRFFAGIRRRSQIAALCRSLSLGRGRLFGTANHAQSKKALRRFTKLNRRNIATAGANKVVDFGITDIDIRLDIAPIASASTFWDCRAPIHGRLATRADIHFLHALFKPKLHEKQPASIRLCGQEPALVIPAKASSIFAVLNVG